MWIVATEPHPRTSEAILVSVTTLKYWADQTVVLRRGDHPFIVHDSTICFRDARIENTSNLDQRVANGEIEVHQSCSPELLAEIGGGLRASPYTAKKVLNFLDEIEGGSKQR